MNLIFCGCSGSGKTTAIRRILQELHEPIYGFWTEKLAPDLDGCSPVYIHGYREPLCFDHLIGTCKNRQAEKFPEVFDSVGTTYLTDIPKGSLVVMDEIGCMESEAKEFINAIFRILDGDYRVIAAVRDKSTPLLDAVRTHHKSVCLTPESFCCQDLVSILR
ncbi:MAG: hypothetical protein E7467_04680 [Ruminococcaceae bacterium]|nr:hypothetical protein [Oscillospiraceae bacterium]